MIPHSICSHPDREKYIGVCLYVERQTDTQGMGDGAFQEVRSTVQTQQRALALPQPTAHFCHVGRTKWRNTVRSAEASRTYEQQGDENLLTFAAGTDAQDGEPDRGITQLRPRSLLWGIYERTGRIPAEDVAARHR